MYNNKDNKEKKISIWLVYNRELGKEFWDMEYLEENKLIIEGDFNIRIGKLGNLGNRVDGGGGERGYENL